MRLLIDGQPSRAVSIETLPPTARRSRLRRAESFAAITRRRSDRWGRAAEIERGFHVAGKGARWGLPKPFVADFPRETRLAHQHLCAPVTVLSHSNRQFSVEVARGGARFVLPLAHFLKRFLQPIRRRYSWLYRRFGVVHSAVILRRLLGLPCTCNDPVLTPQTVRCRLLRRLGSRILRQSCPGKRWICRRHGVRDTR